MGGAGGVGLIFTVKTVLVSGVVDYTLDLSSKYKDDALFNEAFALRDMDQTTGAGTYKDSNSWIEATLDRDVEIISMYLAAFQSMTVTWGADYLNGKVMQYQNRTGWQTAFAIEGVPQWGGKTFVLSEPIVAQSWRISSTNDWTAVSIWEFKSDQDRGCKQHNGGCDGRVSCDDAGPVVVCGKCPAGSRVSPGGKCDVVPVSIGAIKVIGSQLEVDGKPFFGRGVGYAPVPIGDSPHFREKGGDYFTAEHADIFGRDIPLIREMGANLIRLWSWDPSADHAVFLDTCWNDGISPIYVLAPLWMDVDVYHDLSDESTRRRVKDDWTLLIETHKDHPAILGWSIGNELNRNRIYGNTNFFWTLIEELAALAHSLEGASFHPVTTPLIDIDMEEVIAYRDPQLFSLDLWSVQMYRGRTFGEFWDAYRQASDRPVMVTEYGYDSWEHGTWGGGAEYSDDMSDDQAQWDILLAKELYKNKDVCAGGAVLEWVDEWWKCGNNVLQHEPCEIEWPSFPDGYDSEEYSGLNAVSQDPDGGLDILTPKLVYYEFQREWAQFTVPPSTSPTFSPTTDPTSTPTHFPTTTPSSQSSTPQPSSASTISDAPSTTTSGSAQTSDGGSAGTVALVVILVVVLALLGAGRLLFVHRQKKRALYSVQSSNRPAFRHAAKASVDTSERYVALDETNI